MPKSKQADELAVRVTQFLSERRMEDLVRLGGRPPLPRSEIDFLKAFHGIDVPYTVSEVEKMFPGLYFPVKH